MANLYVAYNGLVFGPLDDPSFRCGGGCWPTPHVSRSDRFEYVGDIAYKVVDISIAGKVYDDTSYGVIDTRRNEILDAFNEDFHTLEAGNYTLKHVKVNEVSFDSGSVGVLGFNISLTSYEEWFDDAGIAEPKDEFSYSEGEDGVLTLRHSVSARAVRADNDGGAGMDENDPVANARAWCVSMLCHNQGGCADSFPLSAQTNWTDFDISGGTSSRFSFSMGYNRITGTFSIEETWKQGKYSRQGYVEHYDISEKYNAGNDEYSTIQINYSIKGGEGVDDATIRAAVPSAATFHSYLMDQFGSPVYPHGLVFDDSLSEGVIDPEPVSYEVKENKNESSISVTIAFNQLKISEINEQLSHTASRGDWSGTATNWYYHGATAGYAFLEWDVSVSEDAVTEITTVDVSATMKSKGSLAVSKARISAWFSAISPVSFLAALAFREYYMNITGIGYVFPQAAHFDLSPYNDSFTVEKGVSQITMSATFNNKDHYAESAADISAAGFTPNMAGSYFEWEDLTFDVQQKCAINVLSLKGGKNGNAIFPDYLVYDHNTLSKETTTITVRGVAEEYTQGKINYRNGGLSVADIALGIQIERLQDSPIRGGFIQIPLNNNWDFRGLESHEVTKSRKGVFSPGYEVGNFVSRTASVSQTIDGNFMWNGAQGLLLSQDGFGVLGLGNR